MTRCEKCHLILCTPPKTTSEKDPYCNHCGHVLGTSVQPSVWVCEDCGDTILGLKDHDRRPWCRDCGVPMSCLTVQPSRIHGAGTGDIDLDLGLDLLIEVQGAALQLGTSLLKDAQVKNINHLLTDAPNPCDGCENQNTVYCNGPNCDKLSRKISGRGRGRSDADIDTNTK